MKAWLITEHRFHYNPENSTNYFAKREMSSNTAVLYLSESAMKNALGQLKSAYDHYIDYNAIEIEVPDPNETHP